jgi:hypothetical protein
MPTAGECEDDENDGLEGFLPPFKLSNLNSNTSPFVNTPVDQQSKTRAETEWNINDTFKRLAYACGATKTPIYEAWRKNEGPPEITVAPPVMVTCTTCKHPRIPAYLDGTIHITQKFADAVMSYLLPLVKNLQAKQLDIVGTITEHIHRALAPECYAPAEPWTPDALDRSNVQSAVRRLGQFSRFIEYFNFVDDIDKEYAPIASAARQMRKYGLERMPKLLRSEKKRDYLRRGLGQLLANEVCRLSDNSRLMYADFGDGGEGTPGGVLRRMAHASTLEESAELLFQATEQPCPKELNKDAWPRVRNFYGAVAYKTLALRNFIYGKTKQGLPLREQET